jgi:hypothetical protein
MRAVGLAVGVTVFIVVGDAVEIVDQHYPRC